MRMWKRVLIGTVSAATLGGGASLGISAASTRPNARPVEVRHEPEVRHEVQPADDNATLPQAAPTTDAALQNESSENGNDVENEAGEVENEAGDDQGQDEGHERGNDDGAGHDRNDDHGRDG